MVRFLLAFFLIFVISGCTTKQLQHSQSAIILIKTPSMKFYDSGFIEHYNDHVQLSILSVGKTVLKLEIYKDKICKDTFRCLHPQEFNTRFLHSSYPDDFLYTLLSSSQKNISYKDKEHNILIKIKH